MALGLIVLVAGLIVLTFAADQLVIGASRLAIRLRISPVVVGAVIIGFGTSAPEMLVSGLAAGQNDPDLGVGNIIGSNAANLSLVLGVAAIARAIPVQPHTLRNEGLISLAAVGLFAGLVIDGFNRWEGAGLVVAFTLAMWLLIRSAKVQPAAPTVLADDQTRTYRARTETLRAVLGVIATVGAAQMVVFGAEEVAEEAGIGTGFVGLAIVAVATSLPELVTAVQATRRGYIDLVVGNLLGSNIFNSLAVGAIVALVAPGTLEDGNLTNPTGLALWFMLAITIVAMAFMWSGENTLGRREGTVLLAAYLVVIPFLISSPPPEDQTGTAPPPQISAPTEVPAPTDTAPTNPTLE